jgi:hypothetical protein
LRFGVSRFGLGLVAVAVLAMGCEGAKSSDTEGAAPLDGRLAGPAAAAPSSSPSILGMSPQRPSPSVGGVDVLPPDPLVWPIVPAIGPAMKKRLRAVFLAGQATGNRAGVFAKVGDSITESASFMVDVGCAAENLSAHLELAAVIAFFRSTLLPPEDASAWCEASNSFTRASATAVTGWSANDALQPFDRVVDGCPAPFDAPMRCELHLLRPSVAIVMFGTNDLERSNDARVFARDLDTVVAVCLGAGVIPVLSTIPPRPGAPELASRVDAYNRSIIEVAARTEVPLLNLWRSLEKPSMVHEGISSDGIHPNLYGGCSPHCGSADFSEEGLRYGYNQRNFTALEALAKIKAVVFDAGRPDVGP